MQSRLVRSKKKTDKCVPLVHVVEAWSLRCVQSPHLYADVYIQTRVRQCVYSDTCSTMCMRKFRYAYAYFLSKW